MGFCFEAVNDQNMGGFFLEFLVEAVMPARKNDFRHFSLVAYVLFVFFFTPKPFLQADGFRLARIDGTMTNKKRQAELLRFGGKGDDGSAEVREEGVCTGQYARALLYY